jgi:2-oxoacid:acceptor oxidoreductase delta subunit (pyruvate/2-ketoisovalerate family)
MRFVNAFVRGTCVGAVPDAELASVAAALAERPVEIVFSGQGAQRGSEKLGFKAASAALARRNIRSLLARGGSAADITNALRSALTAPPRDAEYILEDASLELNLRYTVQAAPDAVLKIENSQLVISDGTDPAVSIARVDMREAGRKYFCTDALARLVALPVSAVRFGESAVLPVCLQVSIGAVMEPDTAADHLQKGDWRSTRKPDFAKEYCITCSRCFIHCPDNAIVHAMFDKNAKDTTGILGIDYDRCTACGICASVCPTDRKGFKAIVMISAQAEGTPEVHHVG